MRVAVVSDIHDHIACLRAALRHLAGADVLLCCGDLCSGFIVRELGQGFSRPIHIVFGNNDGDRYRMCRNAAEFPHITIHEEFAELELDGCRTALVHYPSLADPLASSSRYDLVCFGHNHTYQVERRAQTLLLNPGEVMGELTGVATCALYDTPSGHTTRYDL